jgi:integrase/recombinase XerD
MPTQTGREREHNARLPLYPGGRRITEVGTKHDGTVFRRGNETGTDRWWLEVTGKGDRERMPPATAELMIGLGTCRQAC